MRGGVKRAQTYDVKMPRLLGELGAQFTQSTRLEGACQKGLRGLVGGR